MFRLYSGFFKSKTPGSDFEKGLHAITCNVAGLRRWNKFKDNIQLLFEVYGMLVLVITFFCYYCCLKLKDILS